MHLHFSSLFIFFWVVGVAINVALLFVLFYRRRVRQFPIFTLWLAFLVAKSIALMVIYAEGSRFLYTVVYNAGTGVDFALQLGVVVEIARILLRPTGTWVQDARARFVIAGVAGAVVAGLLAWWVSPPASTVSWVWRIRGNLFTSLVICELFVVMTLTANRLGL